MIRSTRLRCVLCAFLPALIASAVLLLAGCGGSPDRGSEPGPRSVPTPSSASVGESLQHAEPFVLPPSFPTDPSLTMAPDLAPTPYTALQIERACPTGRKNTFGMTMEAGDFVMVHHFIETSREGATIQQLFGRVVVDADGQPKAPDLKSQEQVATWQELQGHAAFPREKTRIHEERVTVKAGTYDCWRYDVIEGSKLTRFWFPKSIAGPPVKMEAYVDGTLVAATSMTELRMR